jgi:thiamine biosynthesis protein ThiI
MKTHLVLRIGEIFLKGSNRHMFMNQLEKNIRRALHGHADVRLHRFHGRYTVTCEPDQQEAVIGVLSRIFGLTSISPAVVVEPQFQTLSDTALTLVQALPQKPASFCVKARRTDKRLPFTSLDLEREVGGVIHETCHIPVNLTHPDLLVEIHAGQDLSFVCVNRHAAPGGLPVGISGRLEVLLSGGIDSPVALWMMLKRGATVNATSFYSPPWVGEEARQKVEALCRDLRPWGGPNKLHMVAYGEVQKRLRECRPHKLATVLYRRMMMRTAGLIAQDNRALALVTGESLGQVASQTMHNLIAIEQASPLPVLRPLLGFDKYQTVELAQQIGTYETSIIPCADSCTLFAPEHPETHAHMEEVERAEEGMDLRAMALELARNAVCVKFSEEVPRRQSP